MIESYIKISFLLMIVGNSIGVIAFLLLLFIQQYMFHKKLDPILFNETNFNQYELSIFSSLPLSLIKTIAYQRAIVFPNTMRKRFNNLNLREMVNSLDIVISTLCLSVLLICGIVVINMFIAGAMNYIYY